jgi:hypothetical protein
LSHLNFSNISTSATCQLQQDLNFNISISTRNSKTAILISTPQYKTLFCTKPHLVDGKANRDLAMPVVESSLEYLQKLKLYEEEKPYWEFKQPRNGLDPNVHRLDNLEFEQRQGISILDIRESKPDAHVEECGFQVLSHESSFTKFEKASDFKEYNAETEWLLKRNMNAVYAKTYDWRLRKNVTFYRDTMDVNNPLEAEGPARGVHNGGFLCPTCDC